MFFYASTISHSLIHVNRDLPKATDDPCAQLSVSRGRRDLRQADVHLICRRALPVRVQARRRVGTRRRCGNLPLGLMSRFDCRSCFDCMSQPAADTWLWKTAAANTGQSARC
jgi:hypothetical protein